LVITGLDAARARNYQVGFTGMARGTVTDYMKFFRHLVSGALEDEDSLIGGEGIIV
jgi:hypothetical protein